MEPETMSALSQFGVAGLICWMWLIERRSTAERERQITETHKALMHQREERESLITVVRDNTHALTTLEVGQRELTNTLNRINTTTSDRQAS